MNNYIILVLCKDISDKVTKLTNILDSNSMNYSIVCDACSIDRDQELINSGFYNLTRSPYIKKPNAWDKAFYFIQDANLLQKYSYFYFIEDDVYSKEYKAVVDFIKESFAYEVDFITKEIRPQSHHPTWRYWKEEYVKQFANPSQSFNPLCRLSSILVQKILQYKNIEHSFNFHEITFASLCIDNNLSYVDYIKDTKLNKYIGTFLYHPVMIDSDILNDKIHHPVKSSKTEREKITDSLDRGR